MREYYLAKGPFAGGKEDGLDWWETLPIRAKERPLKALASVLLSIVPHAADVERFFSQLGGTQTVKRCNLATDTFESLGKLCTNYNYHLHQKAILEGKSVQRRHGHMHTRETPGLNTELAKELETNFTIVPPFMIQSGPVASSFEEDSYDEIMAEIEEAYKDIETDVVSREEVDVDGSEILEGNIYNFDELAHVDEGLAPAGFREESDHIGEPQSAASRWDIDTLMKTM